MTVNIKENPVIRGGKMKNILVTMSIIILSNALLAPMPGGKKKVKERYVGHVIEPGGEKELNILIKKWTSVNEMIKLHTILKEKGHKKMCRKFRKMTAGNVWFTKGGRFYISFASSIETPEGRKILLITSDPLTSVGDSISSRIPTRSENISDAAFNDQVPRALETEYQYFGAIHFTLNDTGFSEGKTIERIKIDIGEDGKLKIQTVEIPPKMFHKIRKK